MGNRLITGMLLALVILVFTIYFAMLGLLYPGGQPVRRIFWNILHYVERQEWVKAERETDRLERAWESGKLWVSLNYAEAEYHLFDNTIAHLQAAVRTREPVDAMAQVKIGQRLWANLLRIVPEP
ncbi:MAG TPA: hypothetical protein VEC37_07260 [Bacillota bacterium]|nr:hypothetical protein [Bacillota bacterium]